MQGGRKIAKLSNVTATQSVINDFFFFLVVLTFNLLFLFPFCKKKNNSLKHFFGTSTSRNRPNTKPTKASGTAYFRPSRHCGSLYYMSRTVRDSSLRTSAHCCDCRKKIVGLKKPELKAPEMFKKKRAFWAFISRNWPAQHPCLADIP